MAFKKARSLLVWLIVPLILTTTTVPLRVAAQNTEDTVEAGEATTVTVSANAFDERTDDAGCAPDGCSAENTRDGDLADASRWSCSGELVAAGGGAAGEQCQIVYEFSAAQLVHSVSVAFLKGDTRTRTLNVNVNGALLTVVESGGTTEGLEAFEIDAQDVLSLGLESTGLAEDEFISITEVEIQVSGVAASPPAVDIAPTPAPAAASSAPVDVVATPPTVAPAAAVTSAPVAIVAGPPTAAPAATATSAPVAVVADPATANPAATVTSAPVADIARPPTAAPAALAATSAPVAEVATPAPTASSLPRDLELTPSPTAAGTAAAASGSGATSEGTTTTTSSDDCIPSGCYNDEECMACIEVAPENEEEAYQCEIPLSGGEGCDAGLADTCCAAQVSGINCMAIAAYVDFLECEAASYGGCTIDEACIWYEGSEETTTTTTTSSGIPTASSSFTTATSGFPTDDVCFDCYEDEECLDCIGFNDEYDAEEDQCLEQAALENVCDAIFAGWCCRAAASGNDCMTNQAYVDFIECTVVDLSLCSIDDMDCYSITGFEIGATSSAVGAIAVSDSTSILTFALGIAAAVATRL